MKTRYVIAIKLQGGGTGYVQLHGDQHVASRPTLVKKRSAATLFPRSVIARIVSDWFWEQHWRDDLHDSRSIEELKVRESA